MVDLAEQALGRGLTEGWRPDPVFTVSEWADENRVLVAETTRLHGRWRTERTPYLREIMDCLSVYSPVRHVALMKGSQIGGTELGLNFLGYIIHAAPNPTMAVYPRVEDAEDVSKSRVAPMIEATPALAERVRERVSRGSGNTISLVRFRAGFLKFSGANSAASLKSKPICNLFRDEIDEYPDDVDGQGDPLALSEVRTNTYERKKKILDVSTPTVEGASKIETLYKASDRRRYYIPCPECGHMDFLTWRDVAHHHIEFDEATPELVHMVCSGCGAAIEERHKPDMLARGEWRATAESDGRVRGYHLSALYSPLGWLSWEEILRRFLQAKKDPSLLKTWVNTVLGESWKDDRGAPPKEEVILGRAEEYAAEVPAGVGALVMSVDVQADRLEWIVKGYGADEESWLIARSAIPGDPQKAEVWEELDRVRRQTWRHESGQKLRLDIVTIDSNYKSDHVYRYCRMHSDQRVYAVRGGSVYGVPLVGRPTAKNPYGARLYTLCTSSGKDTVYARLKISPPQPGAPAPGYMHMPAWIDRDYVEQLTAERPFPKWIPRQGSVIEYRKLEGRRNEALDCEVYALAGLYILGLGFVRGLKERARRYAQPVLGLDAPGGAAAAPAPEPAPEPPAPAPRASRRPQRGGWVKGWRR